MNILLVSECTHKALTETRRVLDQFAERTGQRTWQTAITQDGLKTVHYLLKKTARKNTAVACFWVRGKNRTELLWTVGKRGVFNERGRVPTNRTQRNVNPSTELKWKDGRNIEVITAIAALLHDLGKMTVGFQEKLRPEGKNVDPYRHEWISLHLFLLMIQGCESDKDVLIKLSEFAFDNQWYKDLQNVEFDKVKIGNSSFVRLISWLVVSHHKMPWTENYSAVNNVFSIDQFFSQLNAVPGWVRNSRIDHNLNFWIVQDDNKVIHPDVVKVFEGWGNALRYRATEALNLKVDERGHSLLSPFMSYLCRMALVMGDHTYSSMSAGGHLRFMEDGKRTKLPLIANTHRSTREPNQPLSKHLTSVARYASNFAGKLSLLREELPALSDNAQLKKRTPQKYEKFVWQNSARDLGGQLSFVSETQGFFGINMASTGHGKTLGNVKIMTALNSEREKPRITIALGLRILTLQTGEKLKEDLKLTDQEIAALVGGSGVTDLYGKKEEQSLPIDDQSNDFLEKIGSQSLQDFVEGDVFGGYDTSLTDEDFGVFLEDSKTRKLIYTPIISTTIDHLIPASETTGAGRQVVPLLRLLTSDLIFDEVDDFNQKDLYAVTRLIYLTGLLGSRIMLSSATLTPDVVAGLFSAYQAGYREWQKQHQLVSEETEGEIICAWFDEFQQDHAVIKDLFEFEKKHQAYVQKRVDELLQMRLRLPFRQGVYIPFNFSPTNNHSSESDYIEFAKSLLPAIKSMHMAHCEEVPYSETVHQGKTLSTGILRIANINEIIPLSKALFELEINQKEESFQLHVVPYHARQLLLLRSQLEKILDRVLNRKNPETIFQQPEIRKAIKNGDAKHHVFLIVASPVIEVGRDIDVNWAISEPSSMGSLIQLVGRVLRHRDSLPQAPNVGILTSNIRARKNTQKIVYCKPGFEDLMHQMIEKEADNHFEYLFRQDEITVIDSIPRIMKQVEEPSVKKSGRARRRKDDDTQKYRYLSSLEHAVLQDLYYTEQDGKPSLNDMNMIGQQDSASHLYVDLQMRTRFRASYRRETRYILFPVEEVQRDHIKEVAFKFATYEVLKDRSSWFNQEIENTHEQFVSSRVMDELPVKDNPDIRPWLLMDVRAEFAKVCQHFKSASPRTNAIKFLTVLLDSDKQYEFSPWLGFYPRK